MSTSDVGAAEKAQSGWVRFAKTAGKVVLGYFALCALVGLVQAFMPAGAPQPQKSPLAAAQEKIAPDAVMPMKRAEFGKAYARLGASQFEKANALMQWAAISAAGSDQCNKVEVVGLSDSATRRELQWYVNCENGEQFQIKQEQAEATRAKFDPKASPEQKVAAEQAAAPEPKSARWKSFNERVAISSCDTLMQSAMIDRGSFDTAWTWVSEKNDQTGIVIFQRDFEAKNGFGGTISSRYHCEVDADHGSRVTKLRYRDGNGWHKLM